MRDIVTVSLEGDQPSSFICIFKDPLDVNRRKEYHYEADTEYEAAEIVAKITHLIQMHTKNRDTRPLASPSGSGGNRRGSSLYPRGGRRAAEMAGDFSLRHQASTNL